MLDAFLVKLMKQSQKQTHSLSILLLNTHYIRE